MEDPKAFSAPVTALNDSSVSIDKEPRSSSQEAKSTSDLPDTSQETDQSKNEGPDQGLKSEAQLEQNPEAQQDDKSLGASQDDTENKDESTSSDRIDPTTKEADLEANVSASSQTSDINEKKEDQAVDPNIVDWDGPDDPENPMNWPAWKINAHIFLVSAVTFIRCVRYSTLDNPSETNH